MIDPEDKKRKKVERYEKRSIVKELTWKERLDELRNRGDDIVDRMSQSSMSREECTKERVVP